MSARKNVLDTIAPSVIIRSSSDLLIMRTGIKNLGGVPFRARVDYSLQSCMPLSIENFYSPALKKWGLYWIALSFQNSVVVSFCGSVISQMKLKYLWGQLASVDQILYEASLGWGKGCIRFWDRLDQNSGFHGNRKRPLKYNGENDVSTFFSVVFLSDFF